MEEDDNRERGRGSRCGDEDADSELVRGVNGDVGGTDAGGGVKGGRCVRGDEGEEAAVDGAITAARGVGHSRA